MPNAVTGPFTTDEFKALAELPAGEAAKRIREFDPFWGRGGGEKIEWKVEVSGMMHGTAYVTASSQEEADKLADELTCTDIEWGDGYSDDFTILSVEPSKVR